MFCDRLMTRLLFLIATATLLCLPLHAQPYKWKDAQGRTVYSDQPPPNNIPQEDVIKGFKPKSSQAPAATSAPAAEGDAKPAPAVKPAEARPKPKSVAEQEMEFKKRQQDKAEAEEKKQKTEAEEKQRTEYCERSKGYLRALEDGVRIAETNAKGEKNYMDDAKRQRELEDLKKQMRENKCG